MEKKPAPVGLGNFLFRFRSFTPLPVLALLAWRLACSRGSPGPGGPNADIALNVLGLVLALIGQALRFYTLGQVPEGTSGQGSELEAICLNTQGPYAYVRNPLYLGNLGICLGLLLIAHDPWVYLLGLAFFFGQYHFIIRAEETFLRRQFGVAYEEYQRKVPRWLPKLKRAYPGSLRQGFDYRRALKKEHNPFAAWASGALLLLAWEAWDRGGLGDAQIALLVSAEAMVLVAFAVVKAYKRGWLGPTRPLAEEADGKANNMGHD